MVKRYLITSFLKCSLIVLPLLKLVPFISFFYSFDAKIYVYFVKPASRVSKEVVKPSTVHAQ